MSPAAVMPVCPVDQIATAPSTESPAPGSSRAMLHEVIRRHWRSLEASHKPSAWGRARARLWRCAPRLSRLGACRGTVGEVGRVRGSVRQAGPDRDGDLLA